MCLSCTFSISPVIETFEGPLDLANYKDEYREGLQRIIDAKIAGEEIVAPAVETPPRVVYLMEAMKESLDAVSTTKRRPAKVAVAHPPSKRKRAYRTIRTPQIPGRQTRLSLMLGDP